MFFLKNAGVLISIFSFMAINSRAQMANIRLPKPKLSQGKYLRQNIEERRSGRSFSNKKLDIDTLSTVIWATYGRKIKDIGAITSASYTIPSAGAIYPLEIFVVVGKNSVDNLGGGLYRYSKDEHTLIQVSNLDKRKDLTSSCLGQKFIESAAVSIVITANFDLMKQRYKDRAERYVILEAGHAAQNIYLIANDLGLSTVEVGAFKDEEVSKTLGINFPVLLIMPIGYEKPNGKN
jgi:SagB-type dehydrogenase family enzyme